MAGSDYYDHRTFPSHGAAGSSSGMRSELGDIEAGFDKLPDLLIANASLPVFVNALGTELEAVSADSARSKLGTGTNLWCGTAGGSVNALALTPAPAVVAYVAGQRFLFKSGAAANTTAVIAAVSGLPSIAVQVNGAACVGGEIAANGWYEVMVDASLTSCQLSKIGKATPDELGLNVNYFVNGGCQVAQIAAVNLSTTAQYGAVDNVMAWCSTGAVSAGTITQNTTSGIGATGNSFKLAGVTLTGSAVLSVRIRVESKDAVKLKNIASSVAVLVSHDVGAPVNYTVIVRKPTAADNYTATTVISTSAAISVPTGISSATWLKYENIAMGDCSNGIEVEFQIACGAITTKNFECTEFQIGRGATAVAIPLKKYDDELRACQRLGWLMRRAHGIVGGTSTQVWRMGAQCPVKMRAIPTLTLSGTMTVQPGAQVVGSLTALTAMYSSADAVEFDGTIATTAAAAGSPAILTADNTNYIYVDSRL